MLSWDITEENVELIYKIADRVQREIPSYPDHRRILIMDLNACHSNGCPLDFAGLLAADRYEFSHDIYGIRKAIDRTTGKLTEDRFMPRYALANQLPQGV